MTRLPDPLQPFAAVLRSHLERCAWAVHDILQGDDLLRQWIGGGAGAYDWTDLTTGGRAYVVAVPPEPLGETPEGPWPQILLWPSAESVIAQPQQRMLVTGAVGLLIVWDEPRSVIDPGEVSAASLGAYVQRLLVETDARYELQVDRYGGRPLVRRLAEYARVAPGQQLNREEVAEYLTTDSLGHIPTGVRLEIQISYEWEADRTTWTPFSFDPEE